MENNKFSTWESAVQWLIHQTDQKELIKACYYDEPLVQAADRYWNSQEWAEIRKYTSILPGRSLDIGAGNGIASYALAKDGWRVDSLEPNSSNLVGAGAIRKLVDSENLNINIAQNFGEELPFNDSEFELVFARQVLHHARDLNQLCHEVYRVLKPGGKFIAVRDHVISRSNDLPVFLEKHPLHKLYGGENAFLPNQYIEAMTNSGLKIIRILKSFDSVINYAPMTQEMLINLFKSRFNRYIGAQWIGNLFVNSVTFPINMKLLSTFDNRPGRLYSFVCHKPAL